jgi:hypothetical protein
MDCDDKAQEDKGEPTQQDKSKPISLPFQVKKQPGTFPLVTVFHLRDSADET